MENKVRIILSVIFALITCIVMIISILLFPEIKAKHVKIGTYWIIVLVGAIIVVIASGTKLSIIGESLISNSAVNPLKILVLFISMTILSVFIDEMGFFQWVANYVLKKAKTSQKKLFLLLFGMVSILTIFTSNDVIILAFTPFICYFAKNAKISPMPYLASEFVAANSWSMTFIIGNPTNIYLGTANDITFVKYLKVMIVPTIFAGITAFICLYIMYRKELSMEINGEPQEYEIKDKAMLIIGLVHLVVCIIFLIFGSYIGLEMWIVTLACAVCLFICILITCAIKKKKPIELGKTLWRAPWELIPFVLGMFIMILCIDDLGITKSIGDFFGDNTTVIKYGAFSFIACNIINNIPMAVLFCAIMKNLKGNPLEKAIYSTIASSNIGAFFTPIGALAGIMFTSILTKFDIKFGYLDFLKLGIFVAVPTLIITLAVIALMLFFYQK